MRISLPRINGDCKLTWFRAAKRRFKRFILQFESLITRIQLSDEMATKIADALNELHEKSLEGIKKEIDGYEVTLFKLNEKKNKVFDLFLSGSLDEQDYKNQNQRILDERNHVLRLLELAKSSVGDSWRLAAHDILELAKSAKTLWKEGSVENA